MDRMINPNSFKFLQWAAEDSTYYDELFYSLGLCKIGEVQSSHDVIWKGNGIYFFVTARRTDFVEVHGPGVCGIGLNVGNAKMAHQHAVESGMEEDISMLGIEYAGYGIDGVKMYFVDFPLWQSFRHLWIPYSNTSERPTGVNFVDHLTHNCHPGSVDVWAENYKNWFGMYENKYFDIDGKETGLISKAMMSPIGQLAIPLNEDKNDKGQIAKFIRDFNGEGVQHIALHTNDIYFTVKRLREEGIEFLDIPDTYYDMIDERIDVHEEDITAMKKLGILIDGSKEEGILLQIFTKEMVGPVFFEIIQRKGNKGFGHGNFQALFEAIEREQLIDIR